jgi:hypothetical protein
MIGIVIAVILGIILIGIVLNVLKIAVVLALGIGIVMFAQSKFGTKRIK